MNYKSEYISPLGKIILSSDEDGLNGLFFEDQKYINQSILDSSVSLETDDIKEAKKWLDIYFSKLKPNFIPRLHMIGTSFQIEVWNELLKIEYGKTTTYGELAKTIASNRKIRRISSQAIGGAIGHNHIGIIIPCHRVIGSDGSLTGYAGGIDRKKKLLILEQTMFVDNV